MWKVLMLIAGILLGIILAYEPSPEDDDLEHLVLLDDLEEEFFDDDDE